ncbi:helix-turn-helix domain-containing protein [Amycolatopsis sp. NPDC051758]|uniref:helix-turn-helix domain-containing protein n=1 Tax=Amycolatopsis sp. NPDC051758 TaxID=3363935 RepID=UPI0037BAA049
MIELVLGTLDLAKVWFARSPMEELRNSVYVLAGRRGGDLHRPWVTMARSRLAGVDLTVLCSLLSIDHGFPGFMNPLTRAGETFGEQLERVRATDAAGVRCYFDEVWAPAEIPPVLRPLHDDPERALGPFCDLLGEYWRAAIEPVWPRLCSLHEADFAHRSATLTSGGLARLFDDLHPQLEYAGDRLRVLLPHHDVRHTVNGVGVLLKPSAFIWPRISVCDGRDQVSIGYPARGVGRLWETAPAVARAPLADLVGRSRAALLALLDLPRSTTELAEQLGVTAATVSEHLAVLRLNNLVRSRRVGRVVLYERTPRGAGLLHDDSAVP